MRTMIVDGYIVADAEKRISKNGREYVSLRMVSKEIFDEKEADGSTKPFWIGVTCYNQSCFGMIPYLKKNKPIIVEGDFSIRPYVSRDGRTEFSNDITATAIHFLKLGGNENGSVPAENKTVVDEIPTTQVTMTERPKPTTAELVIPNVSASSPVDEDDLPF